MSMPGIYTLNEYCKIISVVATGIIWFDFAILSQKRSNVSEKIFTTEIAGITPDSEDKRLEDKYFEIEKNHFLNSLMAIIIFLIGNLTGNRSAEGLIAIFLAYCIFSFCRVSYSMSCYFDSGFCKNLSDGLGIICIIIMLLTPVITSFINVDSPY